MSDTETALCCMIVSNPTGGERPHAWQKRVNDHMRAQSEALAAKDAEIARLTAERDVARKQERVAKKIVAKAYTIISLVADELEDEGDRVYLKSSNLGDMLRDAREEWDAHRIIGDDLMPLVEENRALKARAEAAEAALRSQREEVLREAARIDWSTGCEPVDDAPGFLSDWQRGFVAGQKAFRDAILVRADSYRLDALKEQCQLAEASGA